MDAQEHLTTISYEQSVQRGISRWKTEQFTDDEMISELFTATPELREKMHRKMSEIRPFLKELIRRKREENL